MVTLMLLAASGSCPGSALYLGVTVVPGSWLKPWSQSPPRRDWCPRPSLSTWDTDKMREPLGHAPSLAWGPEAVVFCLLILKRKRTLHHAFWCSADQPLP